MAEENQSSGFKIVFTCLTAMMSAYLLVYPLVYKHFGVGTTQVCLTLLTYVNYKTACIILLHTRREENDFNECIQRHLPRWAHRIFCLSGSLNCFAASTSYFMYFINVAYKQVEFVMHHLDGSVLSKDSFSLDEFSFQYMTLIGLVCLAAILSVNSVELILTLTCYAFIGAIVYFLYLFMLMVDNLQFQLVHATKPLLSEVVWWTPHLEIVCASIMVSLVIHNNLGPVFKSSRHPEWNQFYLRVVFLLAYVIYSFVGLGGYTAVLNLTPVVNQQNTILDFVPSTSTGVFVVSFFLIYKFMFSIPYYMYIGRMQFYQLFRHELHDPNQSEVMIIPGKFRHTFNSIFLATCLFVGLFNYEPMEFLAIAGGVNAFSIGFVFPIVVHLLCVYKTECKDTVAPGVSSADENKSLLSNIVGNLTQNNQPSTSPCQAKIPKLRSQSKLLKYLFYLVILVMGLLNCIFVVIRALSGKKKTQAFF